PLNLNCASTASGACCAPIGDCTVSTATNCAAGSTWTNGGVCTPVNPCPATVGACCSSAGNCTLTASSACSPSIFTALGTTCAAGGFFGANSVCSAGLCGSPGVVISELYGGGGATASAATYMQDYVELFNRTQAPVDIGGWTIQHASNTGSGWTKSTAIPSGT